MNQDEIAQDIYFKEKSEDIDGRKNNREKASRVFTNEGINSDSACIVCNHNGQQMARFFR